MATTKLTLSVDKTFVSKAKLYALKHQISLSKLISELVNEKIDKDYTEESDPFLEKLNKIEISDKVKSLTGILKTYIPADADLKQLIKDAKYEYLEKKYGL